MSEDEDEPDYENVELQEQDDDGDNIYANVETKTTAPTAQDNDSQKIQQSDHSNMVEREQLLARNNNLTEERDQLQTRFDQLMTSHNNLTEERDQLQTSFDQLMTSHNNLTEERDQLQTRFDQLMTSHNNLTEERDQLQTSYDQLMTSHNNLTAHNDQLQTSYDQLMTRYNHLTTQNGQLQTSCDQLKTSHNKLTEESDCMKRRLCESHGWQTFDRGCYYISTETKIWEESRKWCKDRQSDLIVIKSKEEQEFVDSFKKNVWLGLTDRVSEGSFQWVDGTPLTSPTYWQSSQPNGGGTQNCVENYYSSAPGWNDYECSTSKNWICERVLC